MGRNVRAVLDRRRSCGRGAKRPFSPDICGCAESVPPDGVDQAVIPKLSLPRAPLALLAALAVTLPGMLDAQAQSSSARKSPVAYPRVSVSGSYLAARHAGVERDSAAAALYYRAALRGDPRNPELLNRAFLALLANGEMDEAIRLAERVVQSDKNDRVARLVLGVRGIKQKQYSSARQNLGQSIRGPITDLAGTLLQAWTHVGLTESKAAMEGIDKLSGPDWYGLFKDLHAGLILDLSGHRRDSLKRLEKAYKLDSQALRIVQAYGSQLSRLGNREEALKVFTIFDEQLPRHPLITGAIRDLNAGKRVPSIVDSPQTGAAEVLYGLGSALGRRGGEDLGLIYLQLALYLSPNHSLALTALADLYEAMKKPELAIKTYARVPATSPLYRNALVQSAINLDTIEKTDEARARLEKLLAEDPLDREATM